ncbi:hypothetical protein L3X38_006215 [Prunus dulcis]|uniref:Uncharacterized protein n=1 Tax=Prunus dulcis TaxID=3755 RepID=A0AAD4ZSG7_PRUDU|nr:hypothetical protein L3X38_006215 [Prunus dulcis]
MLRLQLLPHPPPPPPQSSQDTGDLLGLDYTASDVSVMEERNALALAIVSSENLCCAAKRFLILLDWELALVHTPKQQHSSVNERQLAGGFRLTYSESLYDEGAYRAAQQPVYGAPAPNPFEVQDPFAFVKQCCSPTWSSMAAMAQQQSNPLVLSNQPTAAAAECDDGANKSFW